MSPNPVDPGSPPKSGRGWPPLSSLRRFAEIVQNILNLERSVSSLQRENIQFRDEIAVLRREQQVQSKQIEMLIRFVETAINERIDIKAENAVYRILIGKQLPKREANEDS